MKDLLLTLLHLAVMTARLCGPGGVRAVIAEHFLLKQPLIEAATCTDLVSPIRQPRPLCCTIRASCNKATLWADCPAVPALAELALVDFLAARARPAGLHRSRRREGLVHEPLRLLDV